MLLIIFTQLKVHSIMQLCNNSKGENDVLHI